MPKKKKKIRYKRRKFKIAVRIQGFKGKNE